MDEMAVNVQEDGAVELLVDDVGLEDLVVEGLGSPFGGGHVDCATRGPAGEYGECWVSKERASATGAARWRLSN